MNRSSALPTLLRRFLVFATVMFWQGGFTFYGAVVVPVGAAVLGSHRDQGFITRTVTNYLNAAGVVALVVWSWDVAATGATPPTRRRLGWTLLFTLVVLLAGLGYLHLRLDELLDAEGQRILDPREFRRLHRYYLHVSTVQWVVALSLTIWTLRAWRDDDAFQRSCDPAGAPNENLKIG